MPIRLHQTATAELLAVDNRPVADARNARTRSKAQVALIAGSNCTSGAKAR